MELTEEEVIQILKLIEESSFDELDLTMGEMRLVLRRKTKAGHPTEEPVVKAPSDSMIIEKAVPQPKKEKVGNEVQRMGDKAEEILECRRKQYQ